MDTAREHWPILRLLRTDLANRVREFMVVGRWGDGLMVATDDGKGFWLGTMWFEMGDSRTANEPTPLDVPELLCMAQSETHILLLNKQGKIYSIGQNDHGQLGLGTVDQETHFSPQLISSPQKFITVRCGHGHSQALTEDGKVWGWGSNDFYQISAPRPLVFFNSVPSPRQNFKLDHHRVVAVECGGYHSLALTDQGEVYGWGMNDHGQLGDGSSDDNYVIFTGTPILIPTLNPVNSMAVGVNHTLLLTQTGEVYACGCNEYGQLGLPTTIKCSTSLVKVAGLPHISQIASNSDTNLSIAMSTDDQRCFAWGKLDNGDFEEIDIKISTPLKLPPVFSTVESPLSIYSTSRFTSHSVTISENITELQQNPDSCFDNNTLYTMLCRVRI